MPTYSALTTLPGEEAASRLPRRWRIGARTHRRRRLRDRGWLGPVGSRRPIFWNRRTRWCWSSGDGLRGQPFALSELPEVDWVAHVRRELSPVDAGRFFVFGSHDADKVPAGRVPLQIEATVAFGTGHHGTTLGCLLAFDRLSDRRLASGQGCRHRLWHGRPGDGSGGQPSRGAVIACDIDRGGRRCRRGECRRSTGCRAASIVWRPQASPTPSCGGGALDLIFANILKGPLIELAPSIALTLQPGGRAILSGLLAVQADSVPDGLRCVQAFRNIGTISANGRRLFYKKLEIVDNPCSVEDRQIAQNFAISCGKNYLSGGALGCEELCGLIRI